ncbi:alginate lyase family protein [Sphingorhabdus arenilitoris]|uniref:Alginate lyase family protein n=1 Tax=Sphingorhabdus arenilitoris TaxID=1490041 RepID=A0ABV8RJ70_9SPHN
MNAGKYMLRSGLALISLLPVSPLVAASPDEAALAASNEKNACNTLFSCEQNRAEKFVAEMMADGIAVPVPKDPGGGYTHEQHKRNYKAMYQAGQLYRITGDIKYREYVRKMLLAYADLYPTLGDHPARSNQYSGRLFWQVLNDAVWLVYSIQAYEQVRGDLIASDRKKIDDQLFRKAAHFLSIDSKATFNRIHNHATWATAGVGITGYVLNDPDMTERALLGSAKDGKSGFLRQSDLLFSPDGYYSEGPYYQRYAMMPFIVFADAIEKYEPKRKIFEHRDGILLKALRTTIDLTYGGYFFPFNDAIREKSLDTEELYHGVAIAYAQTRDPSLLSIAQAQGKTVLTLPGKEVSDALAAGKAQPFVFTSRLLRDGPSGDEGAVAILREGSGPKHTALVIKNASQGMGHGHFDKLSWQLYDNGHEIIQDYGAARFLNIEAKQGGRYLPENESWAKQSVAHNVLVVDGKSHFDGNLKVAEKTAPQQLFYQDTKGAQISSAKIGTAYPGVTMLRTMGLIQISGLDQPIVVDIMRVSADKAHQYDLPLHYNGHIMRLGFDVKSNVDRRPVLGTDNGYQHIWTDATGTPAAGKAFLTWKLNDRFYTWRMADVDGTQIILGESGANDPDFNLRREPVVIARREGISDTVFASLLEPHGLFDDAAELTVASDSQIKSMSAHQQDGKDVILIDTLSGQQLAFAVSYDPDPKKQHQIDVNGKTVSWKGFAAPITMNDEGE